MSTLEPNQMQYVSLKPTNLNISLLKLWKSNSFVNFSATEDWHWIIAKIYAFHIFNEVIEIWFYAVLAIKSSIKAHSIRVHSLNLHFPKFPTKSHCSCCSLLRFVVEHFENYKNKITLNILNSKIAGHFRYCTYCCTYWRALWRLKPSMTSNGFSSFDVFFYSS